MILEGIVLLRIEDFEERRGRIATEIGAELIDLVEDEQRIIRARIANALNDAARQRSDVGPPMPANLRLVANAAQREAHELAAHRTRDRSSERGLAGSRRPDEAQDRSLGIVLQLAHREEFEDALLDLVEVVMIFVKDRAGVLDIEVVLG